jgi:hypothetical protein
VDLSLVSRTKWRSESKRRARQTPTGTRYYLAEEDLADLSAAAKLALNVIGGASVIASAEDDRYAIASGQFATAYAAAKNQEQLTDFRSNPSRGAGLDGALGPVTAQSHGELHRGS